MWLRTLFGGPQSPRARPCPESPIRLNGAAIASGQTLEYLIVYNIRSWVISLADHLDALCDDDQEDERRKRFAMVCVFGYARCINVVSIC